MNEYDKAYLAGEEWRAVWSVENWPRRYEPAVQYRIDAAFRVASLERDGIPGGACEVWCGA